MRPSEGRNRRPAGEHPSRFKITLGLEVERGKLVCTSVLVRPVPGEKRVSTLHKVKLADLVEESGRRAALQLDGDAYRPVVSVAGGARSWLEAYRDENPTHAPRRGKRLSNEHYQQVADVYRAALASGEQPTNAVAVALHTARSNAGRWVMEARRRGFLGEAPAPGSSGEKEEKNG